MTGFATLIRRFTHPFKDGATHSKGALLRIACFLTIFFAPSSVLAQIEPPVLVASGWGVPSGNRRGGGQRAGSCPRVSMPLTALVPIQDENGTLVPKGSTASHHPTLWFYVPYTIGDSVSASLWLEETETGSNPSADRVYYTQRQVLSLPPTPAGIVSIQLPSSEPALTIGRTYRWLLVVQCDASDVSSNKVAEVELSRVALPSTTALPGASLASQLAAYRRAGLWGEFMTALGAAYCQSQGQFSNYAIAMEWQNMLRDIGLEAIATQPNLACSAR